MFIFSQLNWAQDLFEIYSNKEINIKMHPSAERYNDINYWTKLFKCLAHKYNVKINYIDSFLRIDEIIHLGFFPLSLRGTVGLELIERNIPSILLKSNRWTYNFPELTIHNREDYKKLIKEALKNNNINSSLEAFKPSYLHVSLAHSILHFDKKDFFNSIGIKRKDLPSVPYGAKNERGKENKIRDKLLEKEFLEIIDKKRSLGSC